MKTKEELRKAIQDCDIEIAGKVASLGDEIRSKKMSKTDADKVIAELRQKKTDLEQELAQMNMPKGNPDATERRSFSAAVAEAIERRTAITLNGTGNTVTLAEIFKPAESKASVVGKVTISYGKDANTNIPVLGGAPEFAPVDENGDFEDLTPSYGKKTVTPTGFGASIKVSDYAKKLTAGNLEPELRDSLNKSVTNLVHKLVIAKAKSDVITQTVDGGLTIAGLRNLALACADKFDDGEIYLSSTVYSAFIATATTEADKVTVEGLIRDKEIEGVKVNFSSQMPTATSSGSLLAVAGRWSDMFVGIADQLDVTPKETAGSSVHTIDAICYAAAECAVPANFWKLSVPVNAG